MTELLEHFMFSGYQAKYNFRIDFLIKQLFLSKKFFFQSF